MTVHQLQEQLQLEILVDQTIDPEIKGCYIGDLISWAISRLHKGDIWLTVMGNLNAMAVAALAEAACILLTDSAPLDEDARVRAQHEGIIILSSKENSYSVAAKLARLLPQ